MMTELVLYFILYLVSESDCAIIAFEDTDGEGGGPTITLEPGATCCQELPVEWQDRISGVDTQGGCIILCDAPGCGGACNMFTADNEDFTEIDFNDVAKSFKQCVCPTMKPKPKPTPKPKPQPGLVFVYPAWLYDLLDILTLLLIPMVKIVMGYNLYMFFQYFKGHSGQNDQHNHNKPKY